jgi:hypothetical protein
MAGFRLPTPRLLASSPLEEWNDELKQDVDAIFGELKPKQGVNNSE